MIKSMTRLILNASLSTSSNKKLRQKFLGKFRINLRKIRKLKGLTQQELAEKSGLHLTYVGHLELGKYMPTLFVAWKLAQTLGVNVDKLINPSK